MSRSSLLKMQRASVINSRSDRLTGPIWVYDNWSAYTGGHFWRDDTRLTESLAMEQLAEVQGLKRLGARFDYYVMNGFWADPDGAYRTWHRENWPTGPDRWIEACQTAGLKPGLWFGLALWGIHAAPAWEGSVAKPSVWSFPTLSLSEGGFLSDFEDVLCHWYDRGVRLFELDAMSLDAATPERRAAWSPAAIRESNRTALHRAIARFRDRHADALVVGFNDFGGDISSTAAPFPFIQPIDLRWFDVLDTLYAGDARIGDVPQKSLWRAVDLYSDHMVRRYEQSGIPLSRVDSCSCTLSTTWFGFKRRKTAWRSMLLLMISRGGWKQTIYGDLSLLDDDDARWLARVQAMCGPLLADGHAMSWGGTPGDGDPYGFALADESGALYTAVNPRWEPAEIDLPDLMLAGEPGAIQFRDVGFVPHLNGRRLTLGSGQMAVVGVGRFAAPSFDLGVETDVVIPYELTPIEISIHVPARNIVEVTLAPTGSNLVIVVQQRNAEGRIVRTRERRTKATSDHDPGPILSIEAWQGDRPLAVLSDQTDRALNLGTSWIAAEINVSELLAGEPIVVRCASCESSEVEFEVRAYAARYG